MRRLVFLLFFFPLLTYAQGEANTWYFGNYAGVNFNTTPPTALTNGQLATNEGCSTISDENGNSLFYTDGRTIWNRQHQKMPNADYFGGTGLHGDPSSTSSGLIVPHPNNPNLYFVFTVDEPHHQNAAAYPNQGPATSNGEYPDTGNSVPQADDGYNNGFNYSVVDMSLKNGLGDVVPGERNHHLITYDPNDPTEIKYKCSEKITAVKGADCESIWVLTHFINTFYAFKIDANGVNPSPVVSTLGPIIPITSYRRAAIGYMKISPNGKKLLVAHNTKTYDQTGNDDVMNGGVYLYDFNDATGVVSNEIVLVEYVNAYGVEFSMDSQKAYATATAPSGLKLFQWDLTSPNIPASKYAFPGVTQYNPTALQLAPNGKIYRPVITKSLLGVINHPELIGLAADYSENPNNGAIDLQGRTATFGLPPFIQSIFSSRINIVDNSDEIKTELTLCDGESAVLAYNNLLNGTYTWYRNGIAVPGETSPSLSISQPTGVNLPYTEKYKLVLEPNDGSCPLIGIANVTYYPFPPSHDAILEQCSLPGSAIAIFDLNQATDQILNGLDETKYTVLFYPSVVLAQNDTNPISNIFSYQPDTNPEILGIRVVHTKSGCYSVSQLTLISQGIAEIGEDRRLVYCEERFPEKITLRTAIPTNKIPEYSFLWQPNQETTPTIQINQPGTYRVLVTKLNSTCHSARVFEVVPSSTPTFTLQQVNASDQNSITVVVPEENAGDYVYALDKPDGPYQNSPVFKPVSPGIHTVYVKDKSGCGTAQKEIGVVGIMNFFTPNGDGINDYWRLLGVEHGNQVKAGLYIYDRYGKLLKTAYGLSLGWNGTYHGKKMPSNDYWYCIILENGLTLKGNFTLKR